MASEETILFNYKRAIAQAKELAEVAKEIRNVANDKMETSIQTIDKNWDGDNSKKFIDKSKKLQEKVKNSAKDIDSISQAIKEMAKEIYDAEMRAVAIAKERSAKFSQ